MSKAVWLPTVTTSSMRLRSRIGRNEAGTDALDFVRARLAAGKHGGIPPARPRRSADGRRGFNTWPTPVMVPPVPTAETKTSISPWCRSRSLPPWCGDGCRDWPDCRIAAGSPRRHRLRELLRLGDGALHAVWSRRQHEFGAQQREHLAPFDRHRLGHGEDQPVAARGGDESERDAGIPGGRLDQHRSSRRNLAGGFHGGDHADADPILDAADRVEEFELGQEVRLDALFRRNLVEPHQGRVADRLDDRIVDPPAAGACAGLPACFTAACAMTFLLVAGSS